jgi:peptidoglycan/xylan/chitin deacetylase (PgdA/CDA1 family)
LASRIVAANDEIANHTLTHPNLTRLSPPAVRAQLADAAHILEAYTSDPSPRSMMRPPGGRFTLTTIETVQHAGYDVILWNDDPGDWEGFSVTQMLRHIEQKATAPEILLLHSGITPAIAMLPDLVRRYSAAGYTFVTVAQLLARAGVDAVNDPARVPLTSFGGS